MHDLAGLLLSAGAAAASGGGELSLDVLQAIKETLDSSSQHNAADQLQDQAAQLQYLRECLSFAVQERNQLLVRNKCLTAMLVQQVKAAAASGALPAVTASTATAAAEASAADGPSGVETPAADTACANSRQVGSKTSRRAAGIRRCLSYEVRHSTAQHPRYDEHCVQLRQG